MSVKTLISSCCFLSILMLPPAQIASPRQDQPQGQIGYKSAAGADEKKTLLLRDFQPVSMLHATAHTVDRA